MKKYISLLLALCALLAFARITIAAEPIKNIVLVHGAYADGSGWRAVSEILQKKGYHVSVVQQPETSLAADVAATRLILDRQQGPVLLVGHSYGGVVITEAGNHPLVKGLVYVAAFAPDEGETLVHLIQSHLAPPSPIKPLAAGYLIVDPAQFHEKFAADLPADTANFMAISQVPMAAAIGITPIVAPAWKTKPSFAIVATEDRMIGPTLERFMYKRMQAKVTELKASHAVYVSKPQAVANVIIDAAQQLSQTSK